MKFKIGDKVRIKPDRQCPHDDFEEGTVYSRTPSDLYSIYNSSHGSTTLSYLSGDDLELIEPALEFQIGDRIKSEIGGATGTILDIDTTEVACADGGRSEDKWLQVAWDRSNKERSSFDQIYLSPVSPRSIPPVEIIEKADRSGELLEGYRRWDLGVDAQGEPYLFPIARNHHFVIEPWEPGENISTADRLSPEEFKESNQGFYSVRFPHWLKPTHTTEPTQLSGVILPYGLTVEGERGFRSKRARIKELFGPLPGSSGEPHNFIPHFAYTGMSLKDLAETEIGTKDAGFSKTVLLREPISLGSFTEHAPQPVAKFAIPTEVFLQRISNKYKVPIVKILR